MFKEVVEISNELIKDAYANHSFNEKLLTLMKNKSTELWRSGNEKEGKVGFELCLFFERLKELNTYNYDEKINFLTNRVSTEGLRVLIPQYLQALSAHNESSSSNSKKNLYSIINPNKLHFLDDLYLKALLKDNLALFKLLNEEIAPLNEAHISLQLNRALIGNTNKILDYLFDHVKGYQVIETLNVMTNWNLNSLSDENKKNMIKKVFSIKLDREIKEKMFLKLFRLEFNDINKELMHMMIGAGVDINFKDNEGLTCLHRAALSGPIEKIKYLLTYEADPNIKDSKFNSSPLSFALNSDETNIVKRIEILINAKANLETLNYKGQTPLMEAILLKNTAATEFLIAKGADVNAKGRYGYAPLHLATHYPTTEMLECLIEKAAKLDILDIEGNNTLHHAATSGITENIDFLLKNGFDVNSKGVEGNTATHFAVIHKKYEALKCLAENGANLAVLNNEGNSAIKLATLNNDIDAFNILTNTGVDLNKVYDRDIFLWVAKNSTRKISEVIKNGKDLINVTNSESQNALHIAIIHEKNNNIEALLDWGVDIESLTKDGHTAIQLAVLNGNIEGFNILKNAKANIKVIDKNQRNLFHLAVLGNQKKLIKVLVKAELDINATANTKNGTPIETAILCRNINLFVKLLEWGAEFNPEKRKTKKFISQSPIEIQKHIEVINNELKKNKESSNNVISTTETPYYTNFEVATNQNEKKYKKFKSHPSKPDKNSAKKLITNRDTKQAIVHTNKETKLQQNKTSIKEAKPQQHNFNQVAKSLTDIQKKELAAKQSQEKQVNSQQSLNQNKVQCSMSCIQQVSEKKPLEAVSTLSPSNSETSDIIKQTSAEIRQKRNLIKENFHSKYFYVICRNTKLDHKKGRPGIIICEVNGQYIILLGSSKPPKDLNNQKYFALKLSQADDKITYFYECIHKDTENFKKVRWNTTVRLSDDNKSKIVDLISIKNLTLIYESIKPEVKNVTKENAANNFSETIEHDWQTVLAAFNEEPNIKYIGCKNNISEAYKEHNTLTTVPDFCNLSNI